MVFESVLVDILNRYLKPYVKKLDSSQLKLGAWKGHVRVDKLELKEDLFAEADLDLPIRIKASYIHKLELKIPWKKLTKDPLIITIDEVYVIVGPHLTTEYDPETELKRLRREKEGKIKKIEEARKKKKQQEKETAKGTKKRKDSAKPDTFTEKLVVHLLKNLVVKVRDVHVRYEDPTTNPSTTIAAGVTLHSLELKSTDSNWKPGVVRETATLIYKLMELNCLGFYWNTHTSPLATLPQKEMVEKMREAIARPAVVPPATNEYLLTPVSAAAKLTINLKPGADLNIPQLKMDFECEDIQASLREKQFKSLTYTLEYYDRHATNQKFLKYKPVKPVREDLKGWWRYAITAVLEEDVKRRTRMWSWKRMKQHRELCRLYLQKYREKVHSLSPSSSLLREIEELEDKLDVFNIMLIRKSAKKDKIKQKKPLVATPSAPTLVVPSSPQLLSSPPSPSRRTSSPVQQSQGHPLPLERKGSSPQPTRRNLPPRAPSPTLRSPASGRRQTSPAPLPSRQQPPPSQLAPPSSPGTPTVGERKTVESGKSKKQKKKKSDGFFSNLKRRLSKSTEPGAGAGAVVRRGSGMEGGGALMEEEEEVAEDIFSGPPDFEDEEEKQELYRAIGYAEDEEYEEFPKNYVAHKLSITLASLTLELSGEKQLGNLITTEVKVNIDSRPSAEAVSVSAKVGSLEMTGVPQGDSPTPFINSEVGGEVGRAPLLDFQLEVNPLDVDTDLLVKVTLQPVELIYDSATVDGLIEAFDVPKDIHLQELSRAATATLDQLKYQTTAELQEALKNRKEVQVDVTLHSPFVVLPERGLYSKTASLIVADLGRLTLTSSIKNKSLSTGQKSTPSLHRSDTLSDSYDTFTIGLQGVQVLVARPGEDWRSALKAGSSPLHILDPTSCEIQLLKSIVVDTAYLPSFKIEGNLAGFEVKISNEKLGTIIQIASSIDKPPALVKRLSEIDQLPPRPLPKPLDEPVKLVEAISLDSISVSSSGEEDEDEESSEEEDCILPYSPPVRGEGGEGGPEDAAKQVFIDLSVKLTVEKVAVKLSQVQPSSGEQTPLLDVIVGNMKADVVDRQWDTQGSVTMKSITILDYITRDSEGKPTHLLETESLTDGNFISTRFAVVTQKGLDFARNYTKLQDSVFAQMSLVKIRLERQSLATLLQFGMDLQHYMESSSEGEEQKDEEDGQEEAELDKINPADVKVEKTPEDFYFEVRFMGLDVALTHQLQGVAEATVQGFKVKGTIEKDKTTVSASMEDLEVRDLSLNAAHLQIVSKMDEETNLIALEVVEYNRKAHERDPMKLDWVDTELKADIQRIHVKLETSFLENVLEYIKYLSLDRETLQIAAKATAGTAEVTATAIKESTKTAFRFKMDIAVHAPLVMVPYHTQTTEGEISINLGDFHLSNRFLHGVDVLSSTHRETMNVKLQRVVLDQMVVKSTAIHISRQSRPTACNLHGTHHYLLDCQCTILEPLQVTAQVTRNISTPTRLIPNTDVKLGLKDVKFHLHDEDVKALIMIGLGASKISEVLAPPREETAVEARPKAKSDACMLELSVTGQRLPPGSPYLSVPRPRTRTSSKQRKLYEEITDVNVDLSLQSASVDLTTVKGPLFRAEAAGVKAQVKVFRERVFVSGSTATLSVVDLSPNVKHSRLVTLAKGVHNVSSFEMKIFLNDRHPLSPLGELKATLSKIQFVIFVPTLVRFAEFVQSVIADVGPSIVTKPKKPKSSSMYAVANQEAGAYFLLDVTMHAPAVLLPVSEDSTQSFMVDLGKVKLLNTLLKPEHTEEYIGIDGYGITLESFQISRVLLDYKEDGSPVVAERVLLQPFQLQLTVERNLCPWYTSIPDIRLKCTMGELTIFLGQEDLEQMYVYGQCVAEQVSTLVEGDQTKKAAVPQEVPLPTSQAPPSHEETETVSPSPPRSPTAEVRDELSVTSTLSKFELRLFRKEPQLTQGNVESMELSNDYALASLQLLGMELTAKVLTNEEAVVEASMKDMVLCDQQKQNQKKKTGNRVIQIYTSNPLEAYTGILDTPVINIQYLLRVEEHYIVVKAEKLLVLSDVEFLQAMSEYFTAVFSKKFESPVETAAEEEKVVKPEESVREDLESEKPKELLDKGEVPQTKSSPTKIKMEASIKDFRVALIEDVNAPEPQALTLKVSTFFHMSLSEDNKQGALNVVDLSIATSSFFDLDTTTSWVLLPCSLLLSLTGPIDTPAMDIHGMVDPLYFTVSPPVVRLIVLAANSLIPPKEMVKIEPPSDLWNKKSLTELKPWFLSPVPVHKTPAIERTAPEKGENLTLTFQSVEIILESESTLKSRGHPVLAINGRMALQLSEWSGELSSKADLFCEASYYNEKLSLWEPLLEPLESTGGQLQPWCIDAEVKKSSSGTGLNSEQSGPMFSLSLYTNVPLQLTLTNVSLGLLKSLVESYSKEYGKKVEGSVKARALSGAPFTIFNKLGDGVILFIQPGPSLKLKENTEVEFVKLAHGQSVNLFYKRDLGRRSYASLVYQASDQERHTINMVVGSFKVLAQLLISDPGLFYRTVQAKKGSKSAGIVIDVAVTGTKKTITIRSALQFHNHLKSDVDLLISQPGQSSPTKTLAVLSPDEVYHVPVDFVDNHDFYVRPANFGFEAEGPVLMWFKESTSDYVNLKCQFPDLEDAFYIIRVVCKKEEYRRQIDIPAEPFTHYILHLHPPLVVQNLLPYEIFLGSMEEGCVMRSIAPGKHSSVHDLDIENTKPKLTISVSVPQERSLMGKYDVIKAKTAYGSFVVAAESTMVELSVHTEDLDFYKLAIFSPFWMINKTGLTLEYKEGAKITKHPPSKKIVLLSTKNEKNKIQLGAFTPNKSHTDWTKSFSLNAVGTSGNFSARLGENSYRFGVEVRLSQFTLTKLVIITPYYLLVNETAHFLQVWEAGNKAVPTSLPPGEVVPFWPLKDGDRLVVSGGSNAVTSCINYRRQAFTVLRFDNEVVALCVDVQLLEAANTVTFSSYYPGCVPVKIVNHFQELTLHFWQDSKSPRVVHHTLTPGQTQLYTWDDPTGRRAIKWRFKSTKASTNKAIDISKDGQATFKLKPAPDEPQGTGRSPSTSRRENASSSSTLTPPPAPGVGDSWISIDDTFDEQLVSIDEQEEQSFPPGESWSTGSKSLGVGNRRCSAGEFRGTWKSFIDGLQRVLLFTPDEGVTDRIRAANSYSRPSFEASLSLKAVGLSLVDTKKKRELAYIAATQSGVIWQLEKGNKGRWKTLNNSVIALLEDAHQNKEMDVKHKSLAVNLETMEMFSPGQGRVRRTHHEGVFFRFCLSEKDYSFYGKIGNIQIDNQLPFAVYPHVLYPLPPPPTVASAVEPKPFLEASVILRRNDQHSGVTHFKYFHVLVQKLAVNVDLGFILALVDFFSIDTDPLLEAEYVQSDIEYAENSLKETTLPELSKDFNASKNVFDVLHISPIKILLSFNVRSVGKNKDKNSVGDRVVQLFLHSIGVILTSVQDTEMKLSAVHVEYQPLTGRKLQRLFTKHYKTQALFQLHTLIFGLDVLGNPVSFVRGVVDGAIDLFYEPIKGSVLGPEEFFEGLGIGLRSFLGGTVGGITGAGARITGAFGDVFAKLTFDEDFIDKRQQEKTRPPKMASKLGGFAKNLFEGVTGVVTQPVKGLKKEGAVGLLKGTGRGLVGLLVRPAGGLIDLTSGTLSLVTRKTQIGNVEISDIRPPRFIGPNGVVAPYSPSKAVGTTLLLTVDEGKLAETDFYSAHVAISTKPKVFLLATDRHFLLIEKKLLSGWKATHTGCIKHLEKAVQVHEINVLITYKEMYERKQTIHSIHLQSEKIAQEAADVINGSYYTYMREGRND